MWREVCTRSQHENGWWHDDVIKWKHFPRYWPLVWAIHRWPVNSRHKGQWRGALMFSLICAWINGGVNNSEAVDLRRDRAHYDVTVLEMMDTGSVWLPHSYYGNNLVNASWWKKRRSTFWSDRPLHIEDPYLIIFAPANFLAPYVARPFQTQKWIWRFWNISETMIADCHTRMRLLHIPRYQNSCYQWQQSFQMKVTLPLAYCLRTVSYRNSYTVPGPSLLLQTLPTHKNVCDNFNGTAISFTFQRFNISENKL